jgi:hypothetical protein
MKIDPGMHIGLHLVFFGKTGVTVAPAFYDDEAEDEPHQSGYPLVIGMIVPKEGNAFGLWPLELDSGFAELSGGSDNISWIGCDC